MSGVIIILIFTVGYFFEVFFVSLKSIVLFEYSSILLAFDEPPPLGGFVQRPRVLQILNANMATATRTPHRFRRQQRTNEYWVDNNDFNSKEHYHPALRDKGCEPLGTWQDEVHPACLDFHEIAFDDVTFVAQGNYRDTWLYHEYDGTKRALKMLRVLNEKHNHTYDYVNTERHRKDAVASLQLSSSPFVADIYSYCSSSAVYDFAEGHLWTIFNRPTADGPKIPPTKDELFKIAHDAAMALADTHQLDSEGRVTIIHQDIKPSQFILLSNGEYKLNDLNGAIFASWNAEEETYCDIRGKSWKEYETIDIVHLGQLFNYMLRGKRPYDDPTTVKSPINSTHPFDIHVKRAMNMCMRKHHATARQVAKLLHTAFTIYQVEGGEKVMDTRENTTNLVQN